MAWSGTARVRGQVGGRQGGMVRLGNSLVPRHAVFEFEGENGHPDLRARFEVRDGRPECVEIRITSKEGGRGLRTTDLQLLVVDAMTTNVFSEVGFTAGESAEGSKAFVFPDDERQKWTVRGDVDDAVKTPGRGVSRVELERVAQIYREHVDSSPTRAVMELLPCKSERTAARRVQQARDAGLLAATTPGKRKA